MIEMKKDYEKLMEDIRKINENWDVFYDTAEDFPDGTQYYSNVHVCDESRCLVEIFDEDYGVNDAIFLYDTVDGQNLLELIEEFMSIPTTGIKCPLCDGVAEYRQGIDESVHAWVCTDCSFVGFEFYDDDNYHALGDMLNIAK